MQIVWIVLSILFGIYIIFALAPSVVFYLCIFGRKKGRGFESISGGYLQPYAQEMYAARDFFGSLPQEELTLTAQDGVRLKAHYYDAGSTRTAILMHGYHSSAMINFCILGRDLYEQGFNILLPVQRAHDASGGRSCCFGMWEQYDLLQWVELMTQRGAEQLLLGGVSMGSTTVAYASDKLGGSCVKALLLDCGFASPYLQLRHDSVVRHIPWQVMMPHIILFAKLFLHIDIRETACRSLEKNRIPAFFLHGTDDPTVPYEQSQMCAAACASEKELLIVPGAKHTTSYFAEGSPAPERVRQFLAKYFDLTTQNGGN